MKSLISLSLAVFLLLTGCSPSRNTVVEQPVAPVYQRPVAPGPTYVWIDGDWRWHGGNYVYRNGYWAKPRAKKTYVAGAWVKTNKGYYWRKGTWKR